MHGSRKCIPDPNKSQHSTGAGFSSDEVTCQFCDAEAIMNSELQHINDQLTNPTAFSLDWLACQANMSPRQFQRKFHERIGLSPKLYSRISRFWKAFEYKEKNPSSDWLSIALQFGYSDYYHLSKDFKQFAHVTPNILIEEYSKRPEIVFSNFLDKL
jgi:transcriptional regulator GlxA family with amidase domain